MARTFGGYSRTRDTQNGAIRMGLATAVTLSTGTGATLVCTTSSVGTVGISPILTIGRQIRDRPAPRHRSVSAPLARFLRWNRSDPDKVVRPIVDQLAQLNQRLDDAHEAYMQERAEGNEHS
jgi:hypothetical protein